MNRSFLIVVVRIVDVIAVLLLAIATYWMRHGNFNFSVLQGTIVIIGPILISYTMSMVGSYHADKAFNLLHAFRSIGNAFIISLFFLLFIGYATKTSGEISRIWAVSWIIISFLSIMTIRILIRYAANRPPLKDKLSRKLIIIGTDEFVSNLEKWFDESYRGLVHLKNVVKIGDDPQVDKGLSLCINKTSSLCNASLPDDIIIAVPSHLSGVIEEIAKGLVHHNCNFALCLDRGFTQFPFKTIHSIIGVPAIQIASRPLQGWEAIIKWAEDKILGAIFLALALPIMAAAAIAIRIDSSGPILFKQERLGRGNRRFVVYKFRTMYYVENDPAVPQATRNDPRVTKIGRFLRRTSIDELPQLFNVMGGTMSLVGPRPHAIPHNDEYSLLIGDYFTRHRVKPGITGWAQINGLRGETSNNETMQERVDYDIFYIENWSVWFDFLIIVKTIPLFFLDESAY